MKQNERIRKAAKSNRVPFWEIADALGISEPTFTRWMRKPLSAEMEERIMQMDDCKAWIFEELAMAGGSIKTKELDEKAQAAGYSVKTYKAAKTEMKNEGLIDFRPVTVGTGRNAREWYTVIPTDMQELPNDIPVPFDEL